MIYNDVNFVQPDEMTGSVGFTLKNDDIVNQNENIDCELYSDRISEYDFVEEKDGVIVCSDLNNRIYTTYNLKRDGLYIHSNT